MNLALVSREFPPFHGGGIGTYAANVSRALADAGAGVHVITESAPSHPRLELDRGVTIHRLTTPHDDAPWPVRLSAFSIAAARRILELAHSGAIDAAEFAECEGAGAALALLDRRVPTIVHLHTPTEALVALDSLPSGPMRSATIAAERLAIAHAGAILAPSRFIASWAHRWFDLTDAPAVIHYPLPDQSPSRAAVAGSRTVLYAGRLEARKGVEPLAHAWRILAPSAPGWTLRLIGADTSTAPASRSMHAHLESILAPVRSTVAFTGSLDPASLARERHHAAIAVVPSLWENFPNVCMEAMDAGLPIIASDNGGMREMLTNDCARLHRAGDPHDLARSLLHLIHTTDDHRVSMGAAAHARIRAICDPARIARARHDNLHALTREDRTKNRRAALSAWRTVHAAASGAPIQLPDLTLSPLQLHEDRTA